jgi:hypothetical protein
MRHAIKFESYYNNLDLFTAGNYYIEGITVVDPNGYCILTPRMNGKVKNHKCLGFKYSTNGGETSMSIFTASVKNCFFKVNDDVLKLYNSNSLFEDIVMFT